jgi:cysteine desulfurase
MSSAHPSVVYLDHAATSPIRPEAREAMLAALDIGANASAVHAKGRAARAVIEAARAEVAALVGAAPSQVVFTSGGAEANTLAVEGLAASGAKTLIVSAIEHPSVSEAAKATGLLVEVWPVTAEGVVDLDWLSARLEAWDEATDRRLAVGLMLANNETGAIQPVAEVSRLVRARNGLLHIDAVQAVGKIAVDLEALGADTLTLSAHKIGGPQGSGALVFGPRAVIRRRIHGGGHEQGLRAGTENLSGVAGFGAAAKVSLAHLPQMAQLALWRDAAAQKVKAAGAVVAAEAAPRLPTILNIAVAEFPSQTQLMLLDLEGVMVSAGSACSSGKTTASGVLTAMGYGDLAKGALRVSSGWSTTQADWDRFTTVWLAAYARHAARREVA